MELYLDTKTFKITSDVGDEYTLETAKQMWQRGLVENYNGSFQRLIERNFDLDAVRNFYRDAK